jgi:hypothetical protein
MQQDPTVLLSEITALFDQASSATASLTLQQKLAPSENIANLLSINYRVLQVICLHTTVSLNCV